MSVKSSMKTQSIKLNYKSHKKDFIKTSTVCFAFSAHLNKNHLLMSRKGETDC